jgi:hypothetical protein
MTTRDPLILEARKTLGRLLRMIERYDNADPPNYSARYRCVYGALYAALRAGYAGGVAIDPKEPDWPVVYIELPTGQVSWHMPAHVKAWDEHSTATKYNRTAAYTYLVAGIE